MPLHNSVIQSKVSSSLSEEINQINCCNVLWLQAGKLFLALAQIIVELFPHGCVWLILGIRSLGSNRFSLIIAKFHGSIICIIIKNHGRGQSILIFGWNNIVGKGHCWVLLFICHGRGCPQALLRLWTKHVGSHYPCSGSLMGSWQQVLALL